MTHVQYDVMLPPFLIQQPPDVTAISPGDALTWSFSPAVSGITVVVQVLAVTSSLFSRCRTRLSCLGWPLARTRGCTAATRSGGACGRSRAPPLPPPPMAAPLAAAPTALSVPRPSPVWALRWRTSRVAVAERGFRSRPLRSCDESRACGPDGEEGKPTPPEETATATWER